MALEAANFVISFCVITFLFAMIFKLLPDVHVAWRDVWRGAALTSLLFAPPARWASSCSGSSPPCRRRRRCR